VRPIPRDASLDSTLALFREPYDFVSNRCRRHGTDLFEARVMLRRTICMTGPEAAKLFYDQDRFIRRGAMPEPIRATLLGKGGIQGLDDQDHRHRKRMFLSLMTPESIGRLGDLVADHWRVQARRWVSMDRVVLYPELHPILTRAVCAWAGVALAEGEVIRRTRQLVAMFDAAGSLGPRHLWSRLARRRAERWIGGIVEQVRAGRLSPPEQSPLHVIASYRGPDDVLLPARLAAVAVLNLLRPTVAVSVFITFAAHALHRHPECRERLAKDEDGYRDLFVQEVRRFYPFFPAVMARVRQDFEWRGYHFPQGRSVMLDLYGTDRDARTWDSPDEFRPERFRHWDQSPFNFIPQGGGEHHVTHRCPGEWITIALMKVALGFLTNGMTYDVPEQDLRIDRARLPALPHSRFVISNVRES
jgi:fatty-acid peroxygenase